MIGGRPFSGRSWAFTIAVIGESQFENCSDIGFFELLGIELATLSKPANVGFVRMSRYESGDRVDPERVSKFVLQLLKSFLQIDENSLLEKARRSQTMRLVVALIEATENTRLHAYPQSIRKDSKQAPKWWVAAAAYPEEKRLTLIVYDHGVSIPGSLEDEDQQGWAGRAWIGQVTQRFFQINKGKVGPVSDHVSIRLAMNYGTSSTGKRHRGKGLPALKAVVQHCRDGRLLVLSRRGEYRYKKGARPQTRELPVELPDTLIVWDFAL